MAKIYDENGNKMNLQAICAELIKRISIEDAHRLYEATEKYDYKNSQMKLAHAILDTYKYIDGTNENGMRVRKLLANLMNKYQKSMTTTSTEDQTQYNYVITKLNK